MSLVLSNDATYYHRGNYVIRPGSCQLLNAYILRVMRNFLPTKFEVSMCFRTYDKAWPLDNMYAVSYLGSHEMGHACIYICMERGPLLTQWLNIVLLSEELPILTAKIPLFAPSKSGICFWDGE